MYIVSEDGTLHGAFRARRRKAPSCRNRERKTYLGEYRLCRFMATLCAKLIPLFRKFHPPKPGRFICARHVEVYCARASGCDEGFYS
jgi:hypothetical protein